MSYFKIFRSSARHRLQGWFAPSWNHPAALLIISAICLVVSVPASAVVLNVQYTGSVSSGYDATGIFGTAGTASSLNGSTWIANFFFDTSVGARYSSSSLDIVYGGSGYPLPTPGSGSITINGVTKSIAGDYDATMYVDNNGSFTDVVHDYYVSDGVTLTHYLSLYGTTATYSSSPPSVESLLSLSSADASFNGEFHWFEKPTGNLTWDTTNTWANLSPVSVSVTLVPEPESYAMLLAGLGLLGFMERRRKQKEAAAA